MAQSSKYASFAIKLDVIVEEETVTTTDDRSFVSEPSFIYTPAAQSRTHCSVTLRNATRGNGSDPQFLHTGKWPRMHMVDGLLEASSNALADRTAFEEHRIKPSISHKASQEGPPDVLDVETWSVITADQLSMIMNLWEPNNEGYPFPSFITADGSLFSRPRWYPYMAAAQQTFFYQELVEEHTTRAQTVEHIEELDDNDNAIEIVAILEGYRQNGWAEEMTKAFPRECWLFWVSSGVAAALSVKHTEACGDLIECNIS